MNSSIIALLTLDGIEKEYFISSKNYNNWLIYMKQEELYGEQWLISYECNLKNYILFSGNDYVLQDDFFKHLKNSNIYFYDNISDPITLQQNYLEIIEPAYI